jgi:hypothetical protein
MGEWRVESGAVASGEWRVASGEWRVESGERRGGPAARPGDLALDAATTMTAVASVATCR